MKHEHIKDSSGYYSEVKVIRFGAINGRELVSIDFDPDNFGECASMIHYEPIEARKLAEALIMAAEEIELKQK